MKYYIQTTHRIGANRSSTASFLKPCSNVHIMMSMIIFVMAFYSMTTNASDWEMMLNGKSIPMNNSKNELNQDISAYFWNPYGFISDPLIEVPKFGYHKDTVIYYHVSQLVRRFNIVEDINTLHVDLGVMGFMTNQFSSDGGTPNINVFPLVSVGIDDYAFKISYSPENHDAIVSSWFVQMNINELRFW